MGIESSSGSTSNQEKIDKSMEFGIGAEFAALGTEVMQDKYAEETTFLGKLDAGFGIGIFKCGEWINKGISRLAIDDPKQYRAIRKESVRRADRIKVAFGHEERVFAGINDPETKKSFDNRFDSTVNKIERTLQAADAFISLLEAVLGPNQPQSDNAEAPREN